MENSVTVVCRHNQARSVISAAAALRFFPGIGVASVGVSAREGSAIPRSILDLADFWGLQLVSRVSHALDYAHEQLLRSDYVVVAEDDFIQGIVDVGVEPARVLSMQDTRFGHSHIPFDPIGMTHGVVSVEIAKAVMTTMQLLRIQPGLGYSHPVEAIFTASEEDFEENLAEAWERTVKAKGVLVVADFRSPNFAVVSQVADHVLELQVSRGEQEINFVNGDGDGALERALESGRSFAISAKYEIDMVEKFLLSSRFVELITELAESRSVLIITEPEGTSANPYLAAAHARMSSHLRLI